MITIMNKGLIVIDVQYDLCEGGLIAIPNSLNIIPNINKIRDKFNVVIFSKDWHPMDHISFKEQGGKWPVHCVQGTEGAELHNLLQYNELKDHVVHKGIDKEHDSYSAFYKAQETEDQTQLNNILKQNNIKKVYICGLGLEYSIYATIMDAYRLRYACYVIRDCVAGLNEEKMVHCYESLKKLGVNCITSEMIEKN